MTEHQLEQIHRYTKFKVVETLICVIRYSWIRYITFHEIEVQTHAIPLQALNYT